MHKKMPALYYHIQLKATPKNGGFIVFLIVPNLQLKQVQQCI